MKIIVLVSTIFLFLIIFIILVFPEIYASHLSNTLAFIGSITALLSVVWTQYNKTLEEKNKIEQFREEKKFQLSKEKYQELTNKKIDLFNELSILFMNFFDNFHQIGVDKSVYNESTLKEWEHYKNFYEKLIKLIDLNILLIDNETYELYKTIKDKYNKLEFPINTKYEYSNLDNEEQSLAINEDRESFYLSEKNNIIKLIELLEKEINDIRKKLNP
ncbi:MAG: hypothetical protein PHQ70_10795 [Arcobacter sp.]|uniref:hypothetical protein n=1 Tax=Arcobacter sp. TaxID=1872629 RepID=UPI0025881EBE|nr:hypothetical protein [Arcobacter sp.]MDD3009340.1 hypothetical protein [Arcobacter sp.]